MLMQLKKPAKAGTYESNDIHIMLFPGYEENKVELESNVIEAFGEHIESLILKVLKDQQLEGVLVKAVDKGALDYTIKARLLTAIQRGGVCD